MDLKEVLHTIDDSKDDIVRDMCSMIRIPAIGPFNGGAGEKERADFIESIVKDHFDVVERYDREDSQFSGVIRPNVVARKHGKEEGTVWIISHLDTVLPGDLSKWDSPPFEPRVDGDKIYGLGSEDNGQSVLASFYGAKFIESGKLNGKSLALAFVADEETTSLMGIGHLIDLNLFSDKDFILVPDWGTPNGSLVDVAEKHLLWVKATIKGKQTHGSTPNRGINAFRVSTFFMTDLLTRLEERYSDKDPIFRPDLSTFEPTKTVATVGNINTIPGYAEFYLDCRILPRYDPMEIFEFMRSVATEHSDRTGAIIELVIEQCTISGTPSDVTTGDYAEFSAAVKDVIGEAPMAVGVGGGTCANFFRLEGLNAYVWQCGGGTLHQPNEHVYVSNIITDAKVYASLFDRLCVKPKSD
ncbi:MAG: M20 family metallo-hydrolase [Thermoplasmata archaeon]|nr:M20 family metallo-hydrolase [Thermoplasmata archaeon]